VVVLHRRSKGLSRERPVERRLDLWEALFGGMIRLAALRSVPHQELLVERLPAIFTICSGEGENK
jgi:hypothetical protein